MLTATLLAAATLAPAQPPARQPNIVLILADDLGFSDVGCYGSEIDTPNLDRLAANGLRFRQFYNGTRCCPTRAALLTGLYAHQAGVGNMTGDQGAPGYRGFPQPNTVTIAEVLRAAGYHTAMVGKWHLSGGPKTPRPTDRGFDDFYGMIGGFNSCFQEDPFYTRLPVGRPKRPYARDAFYSTDVFGDYALDFLADAGRAKKPAFLYLAFNAPHFPLHARPDDVRKYADRYAGGWDQLRESRLKKQVELGLFPASVRLTPRSGFTTRADFLRRGDNPAWDTLPADRRTDLARRMAVYAAMVDRMDHAIGRVIDNLRTANELDNTLVMFLSDNGACAEWDPFGFDGSSGPNNTLHTGDALARMGGPGTYHSYGSGWANAGNTPFRLYKHDCHEGGIRTPFVVHWPAGFGARGALRDQPGHVVDVLATCAAAAGAAYPRERNGVAVTPTAGVSLLPAFADRPLAREYLAWEHERNRAIRVGPWKLVAKAGGTWELYNLDADPTELDDRAAAEPARVRELSARWDDWAARNQVTPYPGKK